MDTSNKTNPLSVLIVDDSALMRKLISRIVDEDHRLSVVATAVNGKFALQKIDRLQPDVIALDLEMPEMNGIEFLKVRQERGIGIPVVILSSLAGRGAAVTMEALHLGASDFIMKPVGLDSDSIHLVGRQLTDQLRYYGRLYKNNLAGPEESADRSVIQPGGPKLSATGENKLLSNLLENRTDKQPGKLELIALGVSTGGPNALRKVFAELDADLKVPILVVQHMPAGFTAEFAKSLSQVCPLEVKEAAEGDIVKPGRILIAPGDQHMRVERQSLATIIRLDYKPTLNGHRPSVDALFESVGLTYGNRSMAIIMTGMGRDGADQLGQIYRAGGICLGQDEASCVVYGMPKAAFENGYITRQVSLNQFARTINEYARELCG